MKSEPSAPTKLPAPIFVKHSYEKYRAFSCSHCGIGFMDANDLRTHLLTESQASFVCPSCQHLFSTSKGMKQHFGKLHAKRRPSRCSTCRKRFRNKYALKFHVMQVHQQLTRELCTKCNRYFYNEYSLRRHLKVCQESSE
jgi:KRAB domain-containing zinc finger protein